jgi:hypothetical protein
VPLELLVLEPELEQPVLLQELLQELLEQLVHP